MGSLVVGGLGVPELLILLTLFCLFAAVIVAAIVVVIVLFARSRKQRQEPAGLAAANAELALQREVLARALHRHGRHEADCPAPGGACTCGLDAALSVADGRSAKTP